jgi:hypothetical protein
MCPRPKNLTTPAFGAARNRYEVRYLSPSRSSIIHLMRRIHVMAALLVLLLTTSASVCITGWTDEPSPVCHHQTAHHTYAGAKRSTAKEVAHLACSGSLKSPARCGIRGFDQLQFAEFGPRLCSSPLLIPTDTIAAPAYTKIVISSIGSPETDRGPPRS